VLVRAAGFKRAAAQGVDLKWVISTPDVSPWVAMLSATTFKNVTERCEVVSSLGKPAHLQSGLGSRKVVSLLADLSAELAAERRSELVAKQATVTKGTAVALLLGSGFLAAPQLRKFFGITLPDDATSKSYAAQLLDKRDLGRLETVSSDSCWRI
jgi:hypothetical protein